MPNPSAQEADKLYGSFASVSFDCRDPQLQLIMSETTAQLLKTFDILTPAEQHQLLVELLRHGDEITDSQLSVDHLVGLADELFSASGSRGLG